VFSNTDLLGSRIRNYGRMYQRRVLFTIGVTYQTVPAQVRRIPAIIREIGEEHDNVRFDRAHFQAFGESALLFEIVYYVLTADYNLHMDIQQSINLTLLERLSVEGVEFAYPTRTLLVSGMSP
jgi:small-conductance mechanosensitive channel